MKQGIYVFQPNIKVLRISLLELVYWMMFAVYYPFQVLFLKNSGFSNTTIGMIVAVNSFIVVLAQPFWGIVSDRLQSVKKIFIFCLCSAAILMQPLPLVKTAILTGILFAIITFFESPLMPLLDSWVIKIIKPEGVFYGHVRFLGSLGFAMAVLVYGRIVENNGTDIIFRIFAVMAVLTVFISTFVKSDIPLHPIKFRDLKVGRLFRNYKYITFLIFAVALYAPNRASFIFLPNIIESVSGSESHLGMTFSIMALSEIPVFLLGKKLLQRFRAINLILISTVFFIAKMLFLTAATTPFHVMMINMLQGPSVALFLTGTVYYIDSITPDELKSTSLTLATSIFIGVSGIIGSYGGGIVIDNFGLKNLYITGFVSGITITALFILSLRFKRHACGAVEINP